MCGDGSLAEVGSLEFTNHAVSLVEKKDRQVRGREAYKKGIKRGKERDKLLRSLKRGIDGLRNALSKRREK